MTTKAPISVPAISDDEFDARVQRLQRLARARGLDCVLVNASESDASHVRYLADYWPVFESAGVLVPAVGGPTLLIGPESEAYARDRSRIERVRMLAEYRESADPEYPDLEVASFAEVFEEAGCPDPARIGLAGAFATNRVMLDSLVAAFPATPLVPADDLMIELRSIKSPAEIACLRTAFAIAEGAIERVLAGIAPGMTELQVVGVAQAALYELGAESEGMPQYVLSGPNSRHAISRASHRTLQAGDIVQLNLSARVAGYASGVGRPVCLGRLTPAQRDVIEFAREAHRTTTDSLAPGAAAADIARDYRALFSGRDSLFLYGPCHGIGLMEVEAPWMETTSDYLLAPNMSFQVDTFALAERFGVRWENGIVITDDGVEALSGAHMEVIELG